MKAPHGFLPLALYFTVEDLNALIQFCAIVFAAHIMKDIRHEDGTVRNARLRINESLIMLKQVTG